ncbi:unnamed protein product [Rangifer tarandus platyrhynchus]|uniref:Uncharacterized protein n=1 Tax=Rangifer tarandus platyrhynchus TaxID=3082113 RepID=A0AC60A8W0_RANTA
MEFSAAERASGWHAKPGPDRGAGLRSTLTPPDLPLPVSTHPPPRLSFAGARGYTRPAEQHLNALLPWRSHGAQAVRPLGTIRLREVAGPKPPQSAEAGGDGEGPFSRSSSAPPLPRVSGQQGCCCQARGRKCARADPGSPLPAPLPLSPAACRQGCAPPPPRSRHSRSCHNIVKAPRSRSSAQPAARAGKAREAAGGLLSDE